MSHGKEKKKEKKPLDPEAAPFAPNVDIEKSTTEESETTQRNNTSKITPQGTNRNEE